MYNLKEKRMEGEIYERSGDKPGDNQAAIDHQRLVSGSSDSVDIQRRQHNYRRWGKTAGALMIVAAVGGGVTAAGVKGYQWVTGIGEGVENAVDGVKSAFTPEVDIKMEANAALSNVTLPAEEVIVRGEGGATASTSFDIKCPPLSRLSCLMVPGGYDGVLDYVDSTSKLNGYLDLVAKQSAFSLNAKVDEQNNPYIVATLDMSQVEARRNEDTIVSDSKEYFLADIPDLFNLETPTDEIENANEAYVKSSFKKACEAPLDAALPAGFSLVISKMVETTANDLIREKDPATADWLMNMLDQPIELRFENDKESVSNDAQPYKIKSEIVTFTTNTETNCTLKGSYEADLAKYTAQEGIEYTVAVPLPEHKAID